MASTPNKNSYSSCNISIPKSGTETQYTSSKVLSKAKSGSERRAPEYKLENIKK